MVMILILVTPFLPQKVFAGDLGALVKLDRLATGKTTGGTICAIAAATATENSLQVIFPPGVTVNSNPSNWTVTTTNLPTGSSPMPGIATAQTVSGQTVTFPISDLTPSTQYCFHFASSITTPSTTGTYVGTLRTRDSSNTILDTREFGLAIVSNDSISVSATVPANPTDFQAELSLLDPPNGTYPQNTTFTYSLKYGSLLPYTTSIVVEAQWDLGTIVGSGSPTENVLSYVVGSATSGYNSTPAVIDIVNRKISWTFNTFPANLTNQAVFFKLKTNDSSVSATRVEFTVNGRVVGPGTQTADSSITSSYKYQDPRFITPSPTPTPDPSKQPTQKPVSPTITVIPTPSKPLQELIKAIDIRTISSTDAAIFVSTKLNSTVKIRYGTSPTNLAESASGTESDIGHLVHLTGLKSNTRYYLRVIVLTDGNISASSDLYQFDTASPIESPKANIASLIITSGDVVLTDPLRKSSSFPRIVIPKGLAYGFKFSVEGFEKVKTIKAFIRNDKVLGLASFQAYANTESLTITEIQPGQYIGKLSTSAEPGEYKLVLQIQDFNGNIVEQEVSTLQVVDPLQVINSITKQGIEGAKVTLYFFNTRMRTFELLSSVVTPIKNPSMSEPDGNVWVVLPEGKYRADIEALGYEKKTIEFEIKPFQSANYPKIYLKQLPFNPATYMQYTLSTFADVTHLLQEYLHTLRTSIRFFELIAVIITGILAFLTVLSTARRLSIPVPLLPYYLLFCFKSLLNKKRNEFLVHGILTDQIVGEIVIGATIIASHAGKVLGQSKTNPQGEFLLHLHDATDVRLSVSLKGFKTSTIIIKKADLQKRLTIQIQPIKKPDHFGKSILWYANFLYDSFFEALLVTSLLSELLFVLEFGWLKVLPFIVISLLNVILWAFHVKHSRSIEY